VTKLAIRLPLVLLAAALAAIPARRAGAQLPYSAFGARPAGMGGAAVALAHEASFLDNPAGVGDSQFLATLSVGGVGVESGDFLDPLRRLSKLDPSGLASDPAGAASALRDLSTLGNPGNGVLGTGRAGIAAVSKRWGLAVTELAWAGVSTDVDLVHVQAGTDPSTSILANASRARFLGLRVRDYAVAYSYPLFPGLAVGVTAHSLRGTTYAKETAVFGADVANPFELSRDALNGSERTRTRLTWDAGVLATIGVVRVGAVFKSIKAASFPFADDGPLDTRGTAVTYGRQARIGASARLPILGIQVALDYDMTKNDTLVPGLKSREVGGGVEVPFLILVFRGGLSVNLESPDRSRVISAGLGVNAKLVRVDAAAVYRPGTSALGAVVSVRAGL
jgi:F plasmid transfer operon protein TraF